MSKLNYKPALLCIVSTLMLMGLCFYNGYPIYWADGHAYLWSAFHDDIPVDRPIFYGKFIRITSLWTSLWWTVFAQSFIVSYLLLRFISVLNPQRAIFRFRLVAVMMVAAFTCVSWVCAVVMPDVFTGILLLAIIVYLFDKNKSKFTQFLYVLLMLFAVITHYSHFLIVVLFALCLLAYSLISKRRDFFKKGLVILSTGLVFYLTMCTINYADKKEFTFSRASHIFMVAHFATNGILDTYLDDSCGKKDLRLCVAKGQLSPYHWDFLWPPPSSPLSKIGIWDSCDKEFKGIVHDVFTTPAYLKMFITKSVTATCRQLYTADVERVSGPPIDDWTNLRVKDNFADEYKELALSRQHGGAIESTSFNVIYNLFFIITTIGILLIYSPRDNKELYLVYAVIAVFFVINAFVTANFSTVSARFQNRIFWILPATNAILLLKYLQNRFKTIL